MFGLRKVCLKKVYAGDWVEVIGFPSVMIFKPAVAEKILRIPLAETEHEDLQVWKGESTGEFSVRSAYKLLHELTLDPNELFLHTETINFYRKLWTLQIPSKIKMTIWRISWNYIPSFLNLKIKRVLVNTKCPRCESEEESSRHILQQCPAAIEVWYHLNLSWILNYNNEDLWRWLTGIFGQGNEEQLRLFCCGLWYIFHTSDCYQQVFKRGWATVHFDAAFDSQTFRSASGLIVWNGEGEILASLAVLHSNIEDSFTAEAHAGLQAITLGINLGINKMEIMGDAKIVIKKCKSSITDRSVIGAIIRDIRNRKNCYQEIKFSFIPKAKNIYAHTIATEALKRSESFYLEKGVTETVSRVLERHGLKPPD